MHPQEVLEEKRRQRRIRIMSWVIIALMVLSVGGYYAGSDGATQRYNGIKFVSGTNSVIAKIDGVTYGFNYFPVQVEDVKTDPGVAQLLQNPFIYITYDARSNYSEGMAQVQYYLSDVFTSKGTYPAYGAMTNNSFNLPVVTCANATATEPVLALTESNETRISLQGTCITVAVTDYNELFRVQDKLVLLRLGVMEE